MKVGGLRSAGTLRNHRHREDFALCQRDRRRCGKLQEMPAEFRARWRASANNRTRRSTARPRKKRRSGRRAGAIREYSSSRRAGSFSAEPTECIPAETFPDGAAMLVMHDARRLIENLPAALPRQESKIRVFEIKRREQLIEAAESKEFAAIESAGAAAAIKAGKEAVDRGVLTMADAQTAILPPALRQARFFTPFRVVAKENLAGDGENCFIRKAFEQRREKVPAPRAYRC